MSTWQTAPTNDEQPGMACELSALTDRLAYLKRRDWLLGRIVHIEELDDGYALSLFDADDLPRLQAEVEVFAAEEARCCPFLVLDWKTHPENGILLSVTGPHGVKEFLRDTLR